jgi:hypothetical protein
MPSQNVVRQIIGISLPLDVQLVPSNQPCYQTRERNEQQQRGKSESKSSSRSAKNPSPRENEKNCEQRGDRNTSDTLAKGAKYEKPQPD